MQYSEKDIENMIMDDMSIIDSNLVVIGNQISLGGVGILDILAFDTAKFEYVVIELKSEIATDKSLAQIMRYIQGVKDYTRELQDTYNVRGIIAAPEMEDDTKSSLRLIQDMVTFYKLDISIESDSCHYSRETDTDLYKGDFKKFSQILSQSDFKSHIYTQETLEAKEGE